MERVADVLQQLADKFGVTVEYLWPLLVQHVKMEYAIWSVTELLIIFLAPVVLTLSIRGLMKSVSDDYIANLEGQSAGLFVFCLLVTLVYGAFTIAALVSIPSTIANFYVPEAAVIKDIIKGVK